MSLLPFRKPPGATAQNADGSPWFDAVTAAMVMGFVGTGIYAWAEKSWLIMSSALLLGLAANLVGGLAGFIFGIPKTIATAGTPAAYEGNTNLEQISDWLTKILVGAGLVELKNLGPAISAFGAAFRENQALGSLGWVVAPAIAITYSVCGFLLAYLWARIYMIAELEKRKAKASGNAPDSTAPGPSPEKRV